jgi:hypothetical protein
VSNSLLFLAAANATTLSIGPFTLLFLALPILLLGELLTRKNRWLLRSNVPPPIIGGSSNPRFFEPREKKFGKF